MTQPIDRPIDVDAAVVSLTAILDSLGLRTTALLGNSLGGTWALWYALEHPDRVSRLVLLGAPPLLPGTRVPPPMLAVATPTTGPPPPMPPPSRESVVQSMSVFGEAETIAQYPEQIDAMIAAGLDEIGLDARLAELRAVISPTGWQPALAMGVEELRRLTVPTLLLWGEHDPLGGPTSRRTRPQRSPMLGWSSCQPVTAVAGSPRPRRQAGERLPPVTALTSPVSPWSGWPPRRAAVYAQVAAERRLALGGPSEYRSTG